MEHPFLRNEMIWGQEAQARLAAAHVILFGLAAGSYAAECLGPLRHREPDHRGKAIPAPTNLETWQLRLFIPPQQPQGGRYRTAAADINLTEAHAVHGSTMRQCTPTASGGRYINRTPSTQLGAVS